MTEVEKIAAGLSDRQLAALDWLPSDGSWSKTRAYWKFARTIVAMETCERPLAEAKIVGRNGFANDLRHRLTPLGLAVRRHLESLK